MKDYIFELKDENILCDRNKTVGYNNSTMHMHNLYEIIFVLSDQGTCFVNDRIYEVDKFDVFLFKDTDLHKMNVSEGIEYERYITFFSPNILNTIFTENVDLLSGYEWATKNNVNQLKLTETQGQEFLELLKKLETSTNKEKNIEMKSVLSLAQILCYINDNITKVDNNKCLKKNRHKQIEKIIAYVNKHYVENISLESISNNFYISKSYLCRLFKKETGFQLNEYITYMRMTYAVELLRKGTSVIETSELCGFHSDTYFITIFRRNFGITPKKYMKMISEE